MPAGVLAERGETEAGLVGGLAQKLVRGLQQQARTVAGRFVRRCGPAMRETAEDCRALLDVPSVPDS